MRWLSRKATKPQIGDLRVVERFLWLPVKIENEWRWLERVRIRQKYVRLTSLAPEMKHQAFVGKWINFEWWQPGRPERRSATATSPEGVVVSARRSLGECVSTEISP